MADIERTRAVVDAGETFDGTIIPELKAELSRPVRVREDATVQGSVYGESVEIDPDGSVEGSVMASESVEADGAVVGGEIGTPGRVVCTGTRVEGTVAGERVRLVDCVVLGNVTATELVLEDCIVVGLAGADRTLTVEDSLCYTIRSDGDTVLDGAQIVLPQAIIDGSVELKTPVDVVGVSVGDSEDDGDRVPQITESDRREREGTTYLTLAHRLLNVERVSDRLETLEQELTRIVQGTMDRERTVDVESVVETLTVERDRDDGA